MKNVPTHHHQRLLFRYRSSHLTTSLLLLLLLSSFIQPGYFAQGGAVTGLARDDPKAEDRASYEVDQSAIGSSPPRCERRCGNCVRCTAVQVPVALQIRSHSSRKVAYYGSGEDISNYKPMTWKCKCGDYLFNP